MAETSGGTMRGIKRVYDTGGQALFVAVVLGFASFKTAQGSLYSTAMLSSADSFIMVSNLEFSVLSAAFVVVMELIVVAAAAKGLLPAFSLPVTTSTIVLGVVALASHSGLLLGVDVWVSLVITAFAQGVVTVVLTLAWVEVFVRLDAGRAMKALAASMLVAAILSLVIQQLPAILSLPLILVLLAVNAVVYFRIRREEVDRVASELVSRKPKAVFEPGLGEFRASHAVKQHVKGLFAIGEGLLSLLALGCTIGIINGFMFASGTSFEGSANAFPTGTLVAAALFFVVAYSFPRTYDVSRAYRMLFPLLTALLIAWPFAQFQFTYYFSMAFVVGHAFISTSVMYLIIYEARKRSLNPYMFMGMSVILIRLSSVAGLVAGSLVAGLDFDPLFKTMLIIVIVIYVLSLVLLFMVRTRRGESLGDTRGQSVPKDAGEGDEFERRAVVLAERHSLTERERDIVVYLARGRTAIYIGQALYLSPNTVRGYIKSIYVKLGVHSKQEVIDLFSQGDRCDR